MPKKVFAVTNIKTGTDNFWNAGEEVDHTQFTKEQLKELLDNGAVEIRTVDEAPEAKNDTETSENAQSTDNDDLEE